MPQIKNAIRLTQVSENNLKNIDVEIPYHRHTVIAGVSGSGKSTLAYDVIYATAQRKLLDCMSDGEKIFSTKMKKPKVGGIEGLSPVISLKQIKPNHNPRSTIGTFTSIGSCIRNLMVIHGQCVCPCCGRMFPQCSLFSLVRDIEALGPGTVVETGFPYFFTGRSSREQQLDTLRKRGFRAVYSAGRRLSLRDVIRTEEDDEYILVAESRFQAGAPLAKSDVNCLKNAAAHGDRFFYINFEGADPPGARAFYEKYGCAEHHFLAAVFEASDFSYNHISCACTECLGSGVQKIVHPSKVIKNAKKTLRQGPFFPDIFSMNHPYSYMSLYSLARHYDFPFDAPYEQLSEKAKALILYGTGDETFLLERPDGYDKPLPNYLAREGKPIRFQGILTRLEELYRQMLSDPAEPTPAQEQFFKTYMHEIPCLACGGTRLKKIRDYTLLDGKTFAQLGKMEFSELLFFLEQLPENEASVEIAAALKERLALLEEIGLGYLSFDRRIDSLSGGEYQRLRLANQVGSGLVGLTYIIDEPTDGLHGSDSRKILRIIDRLLQKGSTVITIEHNLDIIRAADYIIELGPGAGADGGKVVAAGTPGALKKNPDSLIGKYLSAERNGLPAADAFLPDIVSDAPFLKILGMEANNLKNIDVEIPLGKITCLTGVSGSGKSSVLYEVLYKAFCAAQENTRVVPGRYREIQGMEQIRGVVCVDQTPPAGKNTSVPATYLDLFDTIRALFSECAGDIGGGADSKSYFSFRSRGACPACRGKGYIEKYIQYFGETRTICTECRGQQYIEEVLSIKYHSKNIKQVLDMTFEDAFYFFQDTGRLSDKIELILSLGLGYVQLGQPLNTLSGGEVQRMKLAREMSRCRSKKNLIYLFDEPTVGLHKSDTSRILAVMRRITEAGNTVVLSEHNPEIILNSDHIIDLGPGAGRHGGEVVFAGTPARMLAEADTKTADYLRACLGAGK